MILLGKHAQNLIYPAMTSRGIETFAEPARRAGTYPPKIRGEPVKQRMIHAEIIALADKATGEKLYSCAIFDFSTIKMFFCFFNGGIIHEQV